jgi:hypothetical protein
MPHLLLMDIYWHMKNISCIRWIQQRNLAQLCIKLLSTEDIVLIMFKLQNNINSCQTHELDELDEYETIYRMFSYVKLHTSNKKHHNIMKLSDTK